MAGSSISTLQISICKRNETCYRSVFQLSFTFPSLPLDPFLLFFLKLQIHPNHSFPLISIPFLHVLFLVFHSLIPDYHSQHEVNSTHFLSSPIVNKTRFSSQKLHPIFFVPLTKIWISQIINLALNHLVVQATFFNIILMGQFDPE